MTVNSFEIGDTVVDREDPSASSVVVLALPAKSATEWLMYGGVTVAEVNPGYPADAPIVVVVAAADVDRYLPEWGGETSLPRTALDETRIYYTAVPAPVSLPTSFLPAMRTLPLTQRSLHYQHRALWSVGEEMFDLLAVGAVDDVVRSHSILLAELLDDERLIITVGPTMGNCHTHRLCQIVATDAANHSANPALPSGSLFGLCLDG